MKLRNIKVKDVIKVLQKEGFEIRRQTGTHIIMAKKTDEGDISTVVPAHRDIIPPGTLKSIEKQSGVDFRDKL